jgi:hypothetical protein
MSRKLILSLAALGALASVALIAGSANALPAHGNGNHGYHGHKHHHAHLYIKRYYGHTYVRPVRYAVPVVSSGPCTCLTKDYTQEGTVVFQDLCTKEMASAPVDGGPAKASEVQAPTNFAGKTYQDYLAANPQKN